MTAIDHLSLPFGVHIYYNEQSTMSSTFQLHTDRKILTFAKRIVKSGTTMVSERAIRGKHGGTRPTMVATGWSKYPLLREICSATPKSASCSFLSVQPPTPSVSETDQIETR